MSKIQIYYFSGTGNTAFIVKKLKNNLEKLGNDVKVTSSEEGGNIDNDFDILGIAFPIHSSFAPKVFIEFLEKLHHNKNKPFFGIVTSGFMAGDVLCYEGKILEAKGYKPFLYRNIIVGNNLNLPILCPLKVTSKDRIDKRLVNINKQIEEISIKVNNLEEDIRGDKFIDKAFGYIQRPIGRIHERINFKGFLVDENCIKCTWCIKNCPTSNIELKNNELIFKDDCILCMRCYNFCPNKAIQMTNKTKNISKYKRYSGPEGLFSKTQIIIGKDLL